MPKKPAVEAKVSPFVRHQVDTMNALAEHIPEPVYNPEDFGDPKVETGQAAFDGERATPKGPLPASAKEDSTALRQAAELMDAYGVPASAVVLRTVADAVASGTRVRK